MKLFASFFSRLSTYATVCIVVASPLFFIPRTAFSPETTYFITMMALVAVALFSYCLSACITKSWHPVSRVELISYILFCSSVILSSVFSRNAHSSLFGESLMAFSGVSFMALPVIMYLVRVLPDTLRRKLKYVLGIMLSVSALIFVAGLVFAGKIAMVATQIFSGFPSATAFASYAGLFALACFFFVKKATIPKKHKAIIIVTAALFIAWAVSFTFQDGVRPNITSTFTVGKNVMFHDGPFGIGSGNFSRAWQLYRPSSVIATPYFGYDFAQGGSTVSTFFATLGIVGVLSFLMLVLFPLYTVYREYRKSQTRTEHIMVGFITLTLLYFTCLALVVPLSYAVLVVWMVVAGLGIAKAPLQEYRPRKSLMFLMIPLTALFVVNGYILARKVQAFTVFSTAQTRSTYEDALAAVSRASAIYPFDGFYRTEVEYLIQSSRSLLETQSLSKEELQKQYLEKAQRAIEAGRAAVKINPDNYQNYVSLARAYELAIPLDKESQYGNAKKAYEEATTLYPENPYLYIMLARLEGSAGTKEGVRTQLTEALKKKQNFADALYLMSQLEASEQKIDEAIAYAVEAIKNAPNDPLVYTQAGLLFYGKKDYQNAILALNAALEKDSNNANVAYFLALALRDGGRSDIAQPLVDELIKRNPGNTELEALKGTLTAPVTPSKTGATPVIKK